MNNKNLCFVLLAFLVIMLGIFLLISLVSKQSASKDINFICWSKTLSEDTIQDSRDTYFEYYKTRNWPEIDYKDFDKALRNGYYKMLSKEEFLVLNVENQRLNKYKDAKTAEEAYPENDQPRGLLDIESVNYFINTKDCVSPIILAMFTDPNKIKHYIKLDGVHRLMAASIRNSPIKVFFINLD